MAALQMQQAQATQQQQAQLVQQQNEANLQADQKKTEEETNRLREKAIIESQMAEEKLINDCMVASMNPTNKPIPDYVMGIIAQRQQREQQEAMEAQQQAMMQQQASQGQPQEDPAMGQQQQMQVA